MNFSTDIKFPARRPNRPRSTLHRLAAGFTLVEMMISVGIFAFLIAAMVYIQIFGLRIYTLAATKLIATTDARETLNSMRDQIRASQQVYVGMFTNSTFSQIPSGQQQIGNALQIFTTTNTASTNFTVFYDDPSTNEIFSFTNTSANQMVVAQYQTNFLCFQAQDFQGNLLTNYLNNPVIMVTMNFSQWEYPIGYVINGGATNAANAYDYYYLRTRIARRCKQ